MTTSYTQPSYSNAGVPDAEFPEHGHGDKRYLINPYGVHWSLMRPDTRLMTDGEDQSLAGKGCLADDVKLTAPQFYRDVPEFAEQHFNALPEVLQRSPEHHFTF